jgi:hypothetical protein
MRASWPLALLAFAPMACGVKGDGPGFCGGPSTVNLDLAPGEMVNGRDPVAMLRPYDGTWNGSLAWKGSHQTVDVEFQVTAPAGPLQVQLNCGQPTLVSAWTTAAVRTTDGALAANGSIGIAVSIPDQSCQDTNIMTLPVAKDSLPPEAQSLGFALDSYAEIRYFVQIGWKPDCSRPAAAVVYLEGYRMPNGPSDQIALADIAFATGP